MFFFPVLSHSSLQLRIRFFHSPYQVILSYFVFFVPSIFLLLLLSYFSFAPPQFLSLSLDAGIVYIFFLLSPSYYIKGLSSLSLSSNSRCLECSNATMHHRCRYTFSSSSSRSYSVRRWLSLSVPLSVDLDIVSSPSPPPPIFLRRRDERVVFAPRFRPSTRKISSGFDFWQAALPSSVAIFAVFSFFFTNFFFRTIGISARAKVTCNQENSIYYIKVELAK